jgi:AraC-like DNA-binding protein
MQLLQHNFDVIGTNYTTDKIIEMYDLGVKIAEVQGNTDQQLAFLNQSNLLNKLQLENQTKTRDLLFDNDVKTLEDYNKQLDIEKSKQELRKKIAIIVAVSLFVLFIVMYVLYKRKIKTNEHKFKAIIHDLQESKSPNPTTIPLKNEEPAVKDHRAEEIIDKLRTLEASNFFIQLDCNLYNTAKLIDTNTSYLSKTLNTYKKQSFNQYLNELRIQYVLIQLNENAKFRAYTLKAISEEIGYKSINTFTKAFKAHTGLTPSYYTKQLAAKNDS